MGCLPFIHVSSEEISENLIQPANQINNTNSIKINNSILQINKDFIPSTFRVSSSLFISQFPTSPYDHYENIRNIGTGSSAQVIKVRNKKNGFFRALKSIKLTEKDTLQKSYEEVEIVKLLDHPNIIKIYDYYLNPSNTIDLISEFIPGEELFSKIKKQQIFKEDQAARIMTQLFSAIKTCHDNNIVHRDIKPENIMLYDEEKNKIKLIDFGTAKLLENNDKCTDKIGTPTYIAPEILKGVPYDFKCDLWSAGVLMYIMLSGAKPFTGFTDEQIFNSIQSNEISFSEKEWKNISESAKKLTKALLIKDPSKRINVDEALNSEWIKNKNKKHNLTYILKNEKNCEKIVENIKKFNHINKLQLASLLFLIHFNIDFYSEEIMFLSDLFELFDLDNDGRLSFSEFQSSLDKFVKNPKISEELTKTIFSVFTDKNEPTPFLLFEEFICVCTDLKNIITTQNIQNTFMVLDKARKGKITYESLKALLINKKSKLNEEIIKSIFKEFGITQEESLSFQAYNQMMKELIK